MIADVILSHDRRGISRVRRYLPEDYVERAASALRDASERVLIVTGFLVAGRGETDGPPGALSLARAVARLGGRAWMVSDGHTAFALAQMKVDGALPEGVHIQSFPLLDRRDSMAEAQELLERVRPTAVVSIERCGPGADGKYRNMRGQDISAVTGCLDVLVEMAQVPTVGIGDGGNEVGLGSLAEACISEGVTEQPCVVAVDYPVIASVSNWGAWGVVAALSPTLLPTDEEATADLDHLVRLGAVDGITRTCETTVDGFSLEENLEILRRLRSV